MASHCFDATAPVPSGQAARSVQEEYEWGMDVLVAGGHGQIGLRLLRLLARRGDRARGLIRDPTQSADLDAVGAVPVVADWEQGDDITPLVAGADAVVFAAGAGPGSGAARKRTVDYEGAAKLIEAAKANDVARYVIVSSVGADHPERASESMRPYLEAKAAADAAVRESGLEWTIVRPGRLTDDPGTGRVDLAPSLGRFGGIPRDDVAAVLLAVLDEPATAGKAFEALSGDVPIADAVRGL
jgi:uncharacterized protein YbjT (DUF2867 family)